MYASGSTTRRNTRSRREDGESDDDDKDIDGECIMMHPYIATWPPLGSTRRASHAGPESGTLKRAGKKWDAHG